VFLFLRWQLRIAFLLLYFCVSIFISCIIHALTTQFASLRTTRYLLRMLCLVFVFRYLMQSINDYSVVMLLCSRCGKLAILNVLRQVSMLCHFSLFLSCVLGVSNNPVTTTAYELFGLRPSLRLRFISENASLLALYVCATTHGPTSLSS